MGKIASDDDYAAQNDANTLKDHADITADPKRHAAAHAKLLEQTQSHQSALDASHKQLASKVKKGLKKAFPGPGTFDQAKGSGGTPFDEAK